ncbi:MAG: SMP-30/gluconolactonase/LRE family protein [Chitinophagaceae bacterium]
MSTASCNNKNKIGYFEKSDPKIESIIGPNASISVIAEGFEWSEGPLWIEKYKMLLFSDIPQNSIFKWTAGNGKELYLKPAGYTGSAPRGGETGSNGLLMDKEGRLVLCQHGDRRMAYMNAPLDAPKPIFVSLADNFQGKKLDSPNDAVYRSNGDLFFTDPPYGLEKNALDPLKESPYQGVYKLSRDGKLTLLLDSITRPNGLAFLPGEKTLIIANSDPEKAVWYAYDLNESDTLTNGRIFYDASAVAKSEKGLPDGLKIDNNGNIFATGPGGIWIFNSSGKVLGKIRINELTSNCAFADDYKTLYVTADMYVLKVHLRD